MRALRLSDHKGASESKTLTLCPFFFQTSQGALNYRQPSSKGAYYSKYCISYSRYLDTVQRRLYTREVQGNRRESEDDGRAGARTVEAPPVRRATRSSFKTQHSCCEAHRRDLNVSPTELLAPLPLPPADPHCGPLEHPEEGRGKTPHSGESRRGGGVWGGGQSFVGARLSALPPAEEGASLKRPPTSPRERSGRACFHARGVPLSK